ncbi:TetR/AcrR family transcriptional regulator [Streptomyces lycii]|uniref:TetR/AcrR family transcriptional regulator n=1 Tax=Streptomyces lycii TaxID=2654337 RepID=A0ABQ7FEI0_9ACTN|nr:TetR/AcrR family transcriptional regulator [Streptomyces lycii]
MSGTAGADADSGRGTPPPSGSGTDTGTGAGAGAGTGAGADTGAGAGRGANGAGPGAGARGEPAPAPKRRRGRPARRTAGEGPGARERILEAARTVFAERGYDKASIRAIAGRAGVDPALVHHYFGTKEQIFAAAIELSFEPALALPYLMAQGPEGVGERMARFFLSVWENPATRAPLLAVVRSAVTHETAAAVLRSFVLRRMLARVVAELAVPDPEFRAELAASQLVGVVMLRYVIKVEPLAGADVEDIVRMVAPTLQRYLTEAPAAARTPEDGGPGRPEAGGAEAEGTEAGGAESEPPEAGRPEA